MSRSRVFAHGCNQSLGAVLKPTMVDRLARACIWSFNESWYSDEVAMSHMIAED